MVCDHSNDLNLLRVCPKVLPKDVIGRDEDGPSEYRPKVRPKDVIGRDEDGPSEDCPKFRPKDSDWTIRRCCLKIVRRSVRRILIGRDEDVV